MNRTPYMEAIPTAAALATSFALALAAVPPTDAIEKSTEQDPAALKFFESQVRPLLAENCHSCHGEEKQKSGLRLDHIDWIKKGGDTGPALVAGDPGESLLIEAVKREDEDFSMPPKDADALSADQVAVLEKWIALGAPWPESPDADGLSSGPGEVDEHGFTEEDREWWAVQPVRDPQAPEISDAGADWARNEIDRFVFRKLEENGLRPAPEASPEELVRRATFDLHGLPPTPEQVASFTEDERPDAWERLVGQLLASPRYGERWAQHWLDVVRYAESDGYRADGYRPDAWRYRDYVIDSLNADKPYDRFVREQLAADEFAPDDPDALIGTAFLRHGIYEYNQRNARMHWDLIMTEMTNVTAEAFLGIGIGCAQCHDHKFDPILQKDHFALRSFLSTTFWPEEESLATPEEKAAYEKQLARWKEKTRGIRAKMDEIAQPTLDSYREKQIAMFPEDIQAMCAKPFEERSAYEQQMVELVERQVRDKQRRGFMPEKIWAKKPEKLKPWKKLEKELAKFDDLKPEPLPTAFISTDISREPAKTLLETRQGKEPVEPAFLTLLGQPAPDIRPTEHGTTGRRLALADWIASPDNPLSTRVIANRVWQHHFGQGIVPTPNDFGTLGEKPSHPELLDWLTSRFLENGWRLKELHRLIMNSAAYRQTAQREPTSDESHRDPGNRLLWRFPARRLSAESLRDAMLAVSGELKERDGGAALDGDSPVRSIYVKKRRNSPDEFLKSFDAPQGFSSTANRLDTTTAIQSLLLANGEWSLKRAEAFALRLLGENAGSHTTNRDDLPTPDLVREAYCLAFGREARPAEVEAALAFLDSQAETVPGKEEPPAKYPGETGLRPITEKFKDLDDKLALGENALWLQPGSRFERLHLADIDLPSLEFTIEAVADLDSIHPNAAVNTLLGRWDGNLEHSGWAFGVTSAKSGYQPRNFIMQLVGKDFQGTTAYEVVASDLRFPVRKPTYFAAALSAQPAKDDPTKGHVTFYLKELGNPKAELQTKTVPHQVVDGVEAADTVRAFLGGRDQGGHRWDGQLARLVISEGVLSEDQLFLNGGKNDSRVLDFDFSKGTVDPPAEGTAWVRSGSKDSSDRYPPRLLGAVTDFCHALLTSNEFLYLQ